MLQYTRLQFARQPDELACSREKHGVHYLRLVRDREHDMRTFERKQTLKALVPNIRAAWAWAIESERVSQRRVLPWAISSRAVCQKERRSSLSRRGLNGDDPEHRAALGYALVQQAEYEWLSPHGGDAPSNVDRALTLLTREGEPRGFIRALARHVKFLRYGGGRTNEVDDMLGKVSKSTGSARDRRMPVLMVSGRSRSQAAGRTLDGRDPGNG
jgi:hypothetical protein